MLQELVTTRLGRGLVQTGLLCPEGEAATLEAVGQFVAKARASGAQSIRIVGTSALREAGNSREFARKVDRRTGLSVEVLPPDEEARISFLGAIGRLGGMPVNPVVFDLGGGSCELCRLDDEVLTCSSLALGAVYLTDMFLAVERYRDRWVEALSRYIRRTISVFSPGCQVLVGIGGTVTTLAAIDLGLEQYDPGKIHGHVLAGDAVASIFEKLVDPVYRGPLPGLPADRAAIMPAGTLVVLELLRHFERDSLVVSEGGLLWGLLISQA